MAKKKTIDLRSIEPTPVPAGDVNIIYNGNRIAGFSEDTDATLKTGGTRVEHDIAVNYTKPAAPAGVSYVPFTLSTPDSDTWGLELEAEVWPVHKDENDSLISVSAITAANCNGVIPIYDSNTNRYKIWMGVSTYPVADILNVTLNGVPVAYDDRENLYIIDINSETYPSGITLTIEDKQV